MKGFVVAGTNSGCGKTTISLALMACFINRGYNVSPFKVGPDFIDPGHHRRITGVTSRNLDGWMLSKNYNIDTFKKFSTGSDIAIVEGVMGLFDGYSGTSEEGSTAQMAKWTDLPVILVVNAQSMARSAAALVQGFENFDPEIRFAGVIFNKLGSENHLNYLKEALEGNTGIPVLGGIFRDEAIEIPERHLGLITNDEHMLSQEAIGTLSSLIESNIDVETLLENVSEFDADDRAGTQADSNGRVKIAVAKDKAFCFYYQENIEIMEAAGAEIVFFSPVEDQRLPDNIGGIYLGGGYPELFAGRLSQNDKLIDEIKRMSDNNMPVYGECGGFMYLCKEITDHDGNTYPMTGCLPFSLKMLPKLKALGYREITLGEETVIGEKGVTARGHEFHYSEIVNPEESDKSVYQVTKRASTDSVKEGYAKKNTLGSYIHLHFGSNPAIGESFVNKCLDWERGQKK